MVEIKSFGLYEVENQEGVTQLAVIISPDELNSVLSTVLIVPLYSVITSAPFRIGIEFKGSSGEIALEKITTVPKQKLGKFIGSLPAELISKIKEVLAEMFR